MSQSFTYSMLFRAMAAEQSSGINNQSALLPVVAQSNADKLSYHKEGGGTVGWQLSSLPSTIVEKNEQSTRTEDLSQVLSFRHWCQTVAQVVNGFLGRRRQQPSIRLQ